MLKLFDRSSDSNTGNSDDYLSATEIDEENRRGLFLHRYWFSWTESPRQLSSRRELRALRRDYFRLPKHSLRTTFEIVVAHRNIIGHCIELLTRIQPEKSIAFNASVTVRKKERYSSTDTPVLVLVKHVVVDQVGSRIDSGNKHDWIRSDLLTMWEIFLPLGQSHIREHEHVPFDVYGVKGTQRKGYCLRLLIGCLRWIKIELNYRDVLASHQELLCDAWRSLAIELHSILWNSSRSAGRLDGERVRCRRNWRRDRNVSTCLEGEGVGVRVWGWAWGTDQFLNFKLRTTRFEWRLIHSSSGKFRVYSALN